MNSKFPAPPRPSAITAGDEALLRNGAVSMIISAEMPEKSGGGGVQCDLVSPKSASYGEKGRQRRPVKFVVVFVHKGSSSLTTFACITM